MLTGLIVLIRSVLWRRVGLIPQWLWIHIDLVAPNVPRYGYSTVGGDETRGAVLTQRILAIGTSINPDASGRVDLDQVFPVGILELKHSMEHRHRFMKTIGNRSRYMIFLVESHLYIPKKPFMGMSTSADLGHRTGSSGIIYIAEHPARSAADCSGRDYIKPNKYLFGGQFRDYCPMIGPSATALNHRPIIYTEYNSGRVFTCGI